MAVTNTIYLDARVGNNTIAVSHDLLTKMSPSCQITGLTVQGVNALTVNDTSGFAVGQTILVGNWGEQGTEILQVHGTTTPTNSVITLSSTTLYEHAVDTPVTVLEFNHVEFYTLPTAEGTRTLVSTVPIMADRKDTVYTYDPSLTGYLTFRFANYSRYLVEDGSGFYIVEVGSGYYITEV